MSCQYVCYVTAAASRGPQQPSTPTGRPRPASEFLGPEGAYGSRDPHGKPLGMQMNAQSSPALASEYQLSQIPCPCYCTVTVLSCLSFVTSYTLALQMPLYQKSLPTYVEGMFCLAFTIKWLAVNTCSNGDRDLVKLYCPVWLSW